eukprot:m51a1_g9391 putative phosphatidate cytidylyltransferase (234) ;mRNA; r:255435-256225
MQLSGTIPLALGRCVVVVLALVLSLRLLVSRGVLSRTASRKAMHILTGPLFVLCWPAFPAANPLSRYVAAAFPAALTAQFALVGAGVLRDDDTVRSMSRGGDRSELLGGPLLYGVSIVALTVVFWLDSPVAVVSIVMLCAGDGMAEVVGRAVRGPKVPWVPRTKKTVAGTVAFVVFGTAGCAAVLAAVGLSVPVARIAAIATASALAEALTSGCYDNVVVSIVATLAGIMLLP